MITIPYIPPESIDFPPIHKKIQSQLNIKATVQNDTQKQKKKKYPKFHHEW